MELAVEARNLTKVYRMYKKPLDRLKEILLRREYATKKVALEGVSFTIKRGEAFGIVGENGAGKSTLLSILAGILPPTAGELSVRGKVCAILELGAGFHPELTGIENVYNYSTLYGLSKGEVDRNLDFIREFSELGEALNQPVRTYSSGMVVRLAFSTIVSIKPDIFIIDEALSVGDSHFQNKSFKRIMEFIAQGGTVIFTTHNQYQITGICGRAMWLKDGKVQEIGNSTEVVKAYEDYMRQKDLKEEERSFNLEKNKDTYISGMELSHKVITPGDDFHVEFSVYSNKELEVVLTLAFRRNDNEWIASISSRELGQRILLRKGENHFRYEVPNFSILYGSYFVHIYLLNEEGVIALDEKIIPIEVVKRSFMDFGVFKLRANLRSVTQSPQKLR